MLRRSLIAGAGATAFVARKAVALTAAQQLLLYSTPPWVLAGASLDFDFENNRYYQQGRPNSIDSLITCSRASTGYVDDSLGNWSSIGANLPRIGRGKGLLVEETRTNLALWCRDFTNAAWIKTTLTAALTAIGIDGTANSASNLTATGVAATALQTIVQLSTADTVSFFIKRVSGSGTVSITGDGVSYTDITASLSTTNWFRATVSATLVNPVIGIKLATNGDVVAVDFAQLEAGTFASSPMLTTTVSVVRAADIVTVTNPPIFGNACTSFVKITPNAPTTYATNQALLTVDDNTASNRSQLQRINATGQTSVQIIAGGATLLNTSTVPVLGTGVSSKMAGAFAASDQVVVANGAIAITNSSGTPASGNTIIQIHIGCRPTGVVAQGNCYIERVAIASNTRLSNADLQRITV